ncbi:MAG TPA: tetratricopeptide repeat protein [Myxococcales bacterium]|nr:tetratricopeptide repeat protein [Myxococcales bacterium]
MIALLVAALVAEPTVVLKPGAAQDKGPSLADRARSVVRRLYEKPEPHVAEGNARATHGDVDGALMEYEKARVPEHGPQAGALAHDKASALLRAGDAQLSGRAIQEANRALSEGDAQLKSQAAYDLGYALEQAGRPDDAIAAYGRALEFDPSDRDAKVNLELLLHEEQRKKQQPQPSGQKEDEKKQQANKDQSRKQQSQQQQNQQQKDQRQSKSDQQQQGQQGQPKQGEDQQSAGQQSGKTGENKELQAAGSRPMDRTEAQRLLDALRAGEKNLQVWRFGKQKAKEHRQDVEKDW